MFKSMLEKLNGEAPAGDGPAIDAASPPSAPPANDPVLEAAVIEAIRTIYDPEIPVNIHELGLIYGIEISPEKVVSIRMTLTSPSCPVAGTLPGDVEAKIKTVEGVADAKVQLTWEPPYHMGMMSDAATLQLNLI